MRIVVAAMLVTACATPYQSRGFRGGYSERSLGPNTWSIRVTGNAFTSRSTLVEYSHRRAGELCPRGYAIVDADRSTDTYRCGDNACDKSEALLIVQCN